MACHNPQKAWRVAEGDPLRFTRPKVDAQEIIIGCKQCAHCRSLQKIEWTLRCVHESLFHDYNLFATLTYDDAHLPAYRSLNKKHPQQFFKNLRAYSGQKFRYYLCGEYGKESLRPHYHAIIFGYNPTDRELAEWNHTDPNRSQYSSPTLSRAWSQQGRLWFSLNASEQSIAYTAGYTLKKANTEHAQNILISAYQPDGTKVPLTPEYSVMSRKPGIGRQYFEKYAEQDFANGYCVLGDKKTIIPKRYWEWLKEDDPEKYEHYKQIQLDQMKPHDYTIPTLRYEQMAEYAETLQNRWQGKI